MTPIFPKNKTVLTFTLTAIMALTNLSPAMASSAADDGDDEGAAGAAAAAAPPKACDDSDTKPFGTDHPIFIAKKTLLTKDVDTKNFDSLFTPLMTDEEGRVLAQEVLTKCRNENELARVLIALQEQTDPRARLNTLRETWTWDESTIDDLINLLEALRGLTDKEVRTRLNTLKETAVWEICKNGAAIGPALRFFDKLTDDEVRARLNIFEERGALTKCNDTLQLMHLNAQFQDVPDDQVSLFLGIFQDTGILAKCKDIMQLLPFIYKDILTGRTRDYIFERCNMLQETGVLAKCINGDQARRILEVLHGRTTEEARERCNMLQETGVLDQYDDGDLAGDQVGEVLKALLHLTPEEARTRLNIIKETGILQYCTTDELGRDDLVILLAELNDLKDDSTRKKACQKWVAEHEDYVRQWRAAGAAAAGAAGDE